MEWTQQALDEELKERRRHSIWSMFLFAGLVGAIALFMLITPKIMEWQDRRDNAERPVVSGQVHARESVRSSSTGNNNNNYRNNYNSAPPEMRLQAVFYNKNGRSTAMIDGKTVAVGGHVAGYTVQAIDQQTVSLQSSSGRTKVLRISNSGQ